MTFICSIIVLFFSFALKVYLSLVQMYLHPPMLSDLGIKVPDKVKAERDDEKAMKILHQYHSKIDTAKVCWLVRTMYISIAALWISQYSIYLSTL